MSTLLHDGKKTPGDMQMEEQEKMSERNVQLERSNLHNAALEEAIRNSHVPRWSRTNIKLYFSVFVAFLSAVANGYDSSLLAGILSMPHFQDTFKTGIDGSKVSLIASLYTVGQIVGAPGAAVFSDRYGRRKTMFVGAILIILGMVIAATGSTIGQFAAGRFVLGFGISVMTVAAPAYTTEIAPPHWRGRCTGIYNCGWYGGSIPAAAITYGTLNIPNAYSWRIPLILQAFACFIVLIGVFFIPESPRFLMANGRDEEAVEFLVKYHGGGDPNSTLVALEVAEFRAAIAVNGVDKRWWDYRPLFATRGGRWRMTQVVLISVSGQYSGNGLGYFNTVLFNLLGVKTVSKQLAYNLLYAVVSAIGAFSGASLTDRMPRRKVLVIGTIVSALWLAVTAGCQTAINKDITNVPRSLSQGALASYFLFSATFMFTYTPLQAVIPSESLETTSRAKGLAINTMILGAMGFLNQFAGPIALANIGYKYIYVFVGWDLCEALLWYLFGVEGQGRTLEELAWVYDQPNPVKASLRIDNAAAVSGEHVSGEVPISREQLK
ncbi:MAG: hypothetical protein TREMPRED_004571 [Tremellales sp. Tagirdzhanova-0007]|nr:MAG: hypothetical protein TREMPRED_004571 [Tremellales sp. Tagirdzhanova-0007]